MTAGCRPLFDGVTRVAETGAREPAYDTFTTCDPAADTGSSQRGFSGALESYANRDANFSIDRPVAPAEQNSDGAVARIAPFIGTTHRYISSPSTLIAFVGIQLPISNR